MADLHHPSLHIKKMTAIEKWEVQIDYHYRLTFEIDENNIVLLTVGMHDEGLGKK